MSNNFHNQPFSESTLTKLALFDRYLEKWLPTFLHGRPKVSRINIVDFFCGPGEDSEHNEGSPQMILKRVREFRELIHKWGGEINVVLNDVESRKIDQLQHLTSLRFADVTTFARVLTHNEDFTRLFGRLFSQLNGRDTANLLFIDQTGISQLQIELFLRIAALEMTDLLFFVSSSVAMRFSKHPAIKRYLDIPENMIAGSDYYRVHKIVKEYYESRIPPGRTYFMGDFSLKKGANIYGLVFGSHSLRGLEKFVTTCWEIDPNTGEANYSIDREHIDDKALYLIPEVGVPQKVTLFQAMLAELIKRGRIRSNHEVVEYYLRNGMLCRHAKPVISRLKNEGAIESVVPISYNATKNRPVPIVLRSTAEGGMS